MNRKTRIGILFGGRSAEHEVSIQSAKNILEAINKEKYEVVLIGINKEGRWRLKKTSELSLLSEGYEVVLIGINKEGRWRLKKTSELSLLSEGSNITRLNREDEGAVLIPEEKEGNLLPFFSERELKKVDVAFPVLHGPYGEDGTIQGLLELANIPYVGAGVLGSAVGMDKDVMKRLLREAGIPVVKFLTFNRSSLKEIDFGRVRDELGLPLFVKPANLGSSIGINKIKKKEQFQPALKEAFQYDNKILIEECIKGREIECSVLGNDDPVASLPGEILPQYEFYSYEAKYLDDKGAILEIPARLSPDIVHKIQELSLRVFEIMCCQGMARVDFFLKNNEEIIVNELNTIPGFTRISMYPKLWEASGIPYPELIDRLIQLALQRFEEKKKLKL
jgi:D-alanine-D-alanine ligase